MDGVGVSCRLDLWWCKYGVWVQGKRCWRAGVLLVLFCRRCLLLLCSSPDQNWPARARSGRCQEDQAPGPQNPGRSTDLSRQRLVVQHGDSLPKSKSTGAVDRMILLLSRGWPTISKLDKKQIRNAIRNHASNNKLCSVNKDLNLGFVILFGH